MCERLKQSVLKTDIPERVSGVRIPLPPPAFSGSLSAFGNSAADFPASPSLRSASLTPAFRLNLKTDIPERVSGVRIPLPRPESMLCLREPVRRLSLTCARRNSRPQINEQYATDQTKATQRAPICHAGRNEKDP